MRLRSVAVVVGLLFAAPALLLLVIALQREPAPSDGPRSPRPPECEFGLAEPRPRDPEAALLPPASEDLCVDPVPVD